MRTHPDHVVAAALAAFDMIGTKDTRAITRAAEAVNVPVQTVRNWITGKRYISPQISEAVHAKRQQLTDRLEDLAHSILDHMPAKLDSAPVNQCAVALGIAIDKRQLLLGQATSIQAGVFLSASDRQERLREIFERRLQGKALDVVAQVSPADGAGEGD